jgi:DNA replication and repair protein RecF
VFLSHITLAHFRNYLQLELDLPSPVVLFQGDNGQGKSNLLEAIYFLATTRSLRAGSDRELIGWQAAEEPIPFARVAGTVKKARADLRVEIVIRADRMERPGSALGEVGGKQTALSKRIKINGVVRRAMELIGQINVVLFTPQDLDLISGAPHVRRHYLDIADCQVDSRYCRSLQQYNRVLIQRNHLLKQIRDRQQPPENLEFWNEELARWGSYLLWRRRATVDELNGTIDEHHRRLTGSGKKLRMSYRSSLHEVTEGWEPAPQPSEAEPVSPEEAGIRELQTRFAEALRRSRRRETMQGVSLVGPHRDDLLFLTDGIDVNVYGSRGEQRAVALALKLSEVEFMQRATGERPLLLLDDVMSELDPSRRRLLLETVGKSGQTLITATDLESFSPQFLAHAALYRIENGNVIPLVQPDQRSYNSAG